MPTSRILRTDSPGLRRVGLAALAMTLLVAMSLWPRDAGPVEAPLTTAPSQRCGMLVGESADDLTDLQQFCRRAIVHGEVTTATADEDALRLHVSPAVADTLRVPGTARRLVRAWVRNWREVRDDGGVRVVVEHAGEALAVGEDSFLQGEEVHFPDDETVGAQ